MLLHFQDPSRLKTKRVVFEETYYARDSGTLELLKDLSSKRKSIEESINGSSKLTPAIAREMAGGVTSRILQDLQKLEKYLPLLENLVAQVVPQVENVHFIQWTIDLRLRWSSPLSSSSITTFGLAGPKFFRIDDLRFELAMTLFLYGALLRERALEVLSALDFVEAATLLRKAAGVYHHMCVNLLPGLQPVLPPEKPPELTPPMAQIMSLLCLAEAQAVTVRKAEENLSSGPLLAKLHFGVVQFVDEAIHLLRTHTSQWNDVSDSLKRFVAASSVLHEARCRRYIAEGMKSEERLGMAVGVLRISSRKAQLLKSPSDEESKVVMKREVFGLNEMLRKCEHENDFIWREKIPRADELPVLEGKKIVSLLPYRCFGLDRDLVFVI